MQQQNNPICVSSTIFKGSFFPLISSSLIVFKGMFKLVLFIVEFSDDTSKFYVSRKLIVAFRSYAHSDSFLKISRNFSLKAK